MQTAPAKSRSRRCDIAHHLADRLALLLASNRVATYAVLLLLTTLTVYAATRLSSRGLAAPGGSIIGRDYFAFFMAGRMVDTGRVSDLYDVSAQQHWQDAFMASVNPRWNSLCLYLNPPHYALAMRWLSRLGYLPSLLAWWGLSLAAFAFTAMIWRRWLGDRGLQAPLLLAICMPAWFQAFAGGQNAFFSLLILTAFAALLIARRDLLAGIVLALLAYKFQLILLPAAFLLARRRWRAILGLAVGGTLTLAGIAATLGTDVIGDYVHLATNLGGLMQQQGFDVHKQHAWYGFFALALGGWTSPDVVRLLTATASCLTLLLTARIWRGPWRPASNRFSLQLAALFIATMVTSPHLFHYDMLLVLLPIMLWLRGTQTASAARSGNAHAANTPVGQTNSVTPTGMLLALGFAWLAVAAPLANLLHIQLTPILLCVWLVLFVRNARLVEGPAERYAPAGAPPTRTAN